MKQVGPQSPLRQEFLKAGRNDYADMRALHENADADGERVARQAKDALEGDLSRDTRLSMHDEEDTTGRRIRGGRNFARHIQQAKKQEQERTRTILSETSKSFQNYMDDLDASIAFWKGEAERLEQLEADHRKLSEALFKRANEGEDLLGEIERNGIDPAKIEQAARILQAAGRSKKEIDGLSPAELVAALRDQVAEDRQDALSEHDKAEQARIEREEAEQRLKEGQDLQARVNGAESAAEKTAILQNADWERLSNVQEVAVNKAGANEMTALENVNAADDIRQTVDRTLSNDMF